MGQIGESWFSAPHEFPKRALRADLDFRNNQFYYEMFLRQLEESKINHMEKGEHSGVSAGHLKKTFSDSTFTLTSGKKEYLQKEEKRRKRVVVIVKSSCILLLLASFIFTIVAVSVLLSNGRTTFGSL